MLSLSPAASTAQRLLAWYDRHHRDLPWRVSPPMAKSGIVPRPYDVWLSEVMLQQTTVQAVKPYFEKFLALWPDVTDLAKADTEEVMKAWAGIYVRETPSSALTLVATTWRALATSVGSEPPQERASAWLISASASMIFPSRNWKAG